MFFLSVLSEYQITILSLFNDKFLKDVNILICVSGDGYIGCVKASMLMDFGFTEQQLALVTPEDCTATCKTNMFPYAALYKSRRYIIVLLVQNRIYNKILDRD